MHQRLKIVLIRHGKTDYNTLKKMSGWDDVPLNQAGIDYLKKVKANTVYPVTDRYYSSDMSRAKDTFAILFGEKHPLDGSFKAFREVCFGDIEGQPIQEVSGIFYEHFLANKVYANGDTLESYTTRIFNGLYDLCDQLIANHESSMTIVAHTGTIRIVTWILNRMPLEDYRSIKVDNGHGAIYEVDYDPTQRVMRLVSQTDL